jgi:hypothetical protein
MATFSQWWREGENDAKTVYRLSLNVPIIVAAVGVAMFWRLQHLRFLILPIFGYEVGMFLVERRRAIIVTDSSLLYRPAFGRPARVDFAQIASVEKCSTSVPSWATFRPMLYKG